MIFKIFSKIFGKCSEIIGKFTDMMETACKRSQELKSIETNFQKSSKGAPHTKLLRASNDGKVEWNTTR